MTMAHAESTRRGARRARRGKHGLLALPVLMLIAGIVVALAVIAWLLWPRWPAPNVPVDAPSLPITVQGVTFNIPPGAIRLKAQRKPGVLERIDLVFMWPSLTPPEERPVPVASSKGIDRIFLTIAASDNTLPPIERFKTIYPRYLENSLGTTDSGLTVRPFRAGTPYQGEELLYENGNPERFLARCTRDGPSAAIGMCLYQRRIGNADITLRFPREWLSDWPAVLSGIERLLSSLRITAR
jgi:hypothetical protein